MAQPYSATLVSNTPTDPWRSEREGEPMLELTGAGSGTVTVEYLCQSGDYAPDAAGTDGGSPIILDKVAYAGSPIRLSLTPGRKLRVNPGTITGAVVATFVD